GGSETGGTIAEHFHMVRDLVVLYFFSLWLIGAPLLSFGAEGPPKRPAASPSVRRWLGSLTLSQKVAQLVMIPFYGEAPNPPSRQYQHFARLVRDYRVGGLVLINRTTGHGVQRAEPYALAAFLNRMQRMAPIPLLVAGDFERGASMRVDGVTLF